MREHGPVFRVSGLGFHIVVRHDDIVESLGRPDPFPNDDMPSDVVSAVKDVGVRLCIGAAPARREIKAAMREVPGRIDNLRFTDSNFEVTHHLSAILRGIEALPVSFDRIDAPGSSSLAAAA